MQSSFVAELTTRRHAVKHAWERKLRNEPITSPLANPDTLVLLMDRTIDELLATIAAAAMGQAGAGHSRGLRSGCLCGLNPLLAYFRVGATVIATVAALGAARCPELDEDEFAACVQETLAEFQAIAQREIRAFCAMCQTEIARGGRPAPSHQGIFAARAGK
jgi:hypothetical protein